MSVVSRVRRLNFLSSHWLKNNPRENTRDLERQTNKYPNIYILYIYNVCVCSWWMWWKIYSRLKQLYWREGSSADLFNDYETLREQIDIRGFWTVRFWSLTIRRCFILLWKLKEMFRRSSDVCEFSLLLTEDRSRSRNLSEILNIHINIKNSCLSVLPSFPETFRRRNLNGHEFSRTDSFVSLYMSSDVVPWTLIHLKV